MRDALEIVQYKPAHQAAIEDLLHEIAAEFPLAISAPGASPVITDVYFVALLNNQVIGTAAVVLRTNYAILKKVFLKKEFRGAEKGISQTMLHSTLRWCAQKKISTIYLGTMSQFKAAQNFYEKNGFVKIGAELLPDDFISAPVDDVFYKLNTKPA